MNIIFFGNGDFSLKSLEYLHASKLHNIVLAVTNKVKKQGRGLKQTNTPIARYSINNNINLYKTNNIKNIKNIDIFKKYNADIFVVIEYKILPKYIFNIPKYGTVNIHASLLPKYRGAAPIQRSIMNGDTTLGVSSFIINSSVDSGKIIAQDSCFYDDSLTYGTIYNELSVLGANLLLLSLDRIKMNQPMLDQNNEHVTRASKISKKELIISFKDSSFNIHNKIRALTPPGPYATINGKKVKFTKTYYSSDCHSLHLGKHQIIDNNIYIGCSSGSLIVKKLQFESKKEISSIDFSNMQQFKNIKFE